VRDNEGLVVIARGQTLSDAQILGMNWLVEGVLTRLPK
jgi:simple sugar transport system substrate-binding protein